MDVTVLALAKSFTERYVTEHGTPPTDAQVEAAIAEYFEEHPVEAPVESVNGKIGAVELTAEDVGALPEDTPIPSEYVLPMASASALGGIKASPKTESETYECKIGADGKLYSAGGGGGGGGAVDSVNGKTGAVVLTAEDVDALPDDTTLADLQTDATHRVVTDSQITAWTAKQDAIPADTYDEYGAAAAVQDNLDAATAKIPAQATAQNQLADKAFVNSSVQTATANFRGNWDAWEDVPIDAVEYPTDYAGSHTPTVNDYLVVIDASDFQSETPLAGTWRFKYSGVWATDGRDGWLPEYQVNETPLTAEQLAALNSGATAEKIADYDTHVADDTIHVTAAEKAAWSAKASAPTLNTADLSGQTLALTAVDNAIYAPTNALTGALTISAAASTAGALYGIDIIAEIGTGGSITVNALSVGGESIAAAVAGETWEINIFRGHALCAKLAGVSA